MNETMVEREQQPRVKLGGAWAAGWFARDLLHARDVVSKWPDGMKPGNVLEADRRRHAAQSQKVGG